MDDFLMKKVEAVKEWENNNSTTWYIVPFSSKSDAVKVANYLRNEGYEVKVGDDDNIAKLIKIIVTRKKYNL